MKIIESNGGPFIAMNRADIANWGGVDALIFFRSEISENDYDHLCFNSTETEKLFVGKIIGSLGELLFISYPLPIVIVEASKDHLYLAQIDGSESGWSPDDLLGSDFEKPIGWQDPFQITLKGGEIVFFDSAYVDSDFKEDILSAEIEAGSYRCDWAYQTCSGKAVMKFIRIMKQR